jgi:hypothetical protein
MNRKRGGVTLSVDGVDYLFRITTNALIAYKDMMGHSFQEGLAAIQANQDDFRTARAVIWTALAHDKAITVEDAGDVMDAVGLPAALAAFTEAVSLAFPQPETETVGNGKAVKTAKPKTMPQKPTT